MARRRRARLAAGAMRATPATRASGDSERGARDAIAAAAADASVPTVDDANDDDDANDVDADADARRRRAGDDANASRTTRASMTPPRALYARFVAVGVGTLFPWNVFITERAYFARRFANDGANDGSFFAANFEGTFANAYALSNLIGCAGLVKYGDARGAATGSRATASALGIAAVGIWTCGVVAGVERVKMDVVFAQTLGVIVVVGLATAVAQSGGFALASRLPPEFAQGAMSGQAVSGVVVSLVALATTAYGGGSVSSSSSAKGAQAYFYVAAAVVLGCAATAARLDKTPAFEELTGVERHRDGRRSEMNALLRDDDVDEYDSDVEGAPLRASTGVEDFGDESRDYRLAVALTFIASLCAFPAITSSIESSHGAMGAFWSPVLFLLFNLGDFLGRHLAGMYPKTPPRGASLRRAATLRFAFIPFLAACNVTTPNWRVPTVFASDFFPFLFISALAVTNGWLASVAMMHGASRAPLSKRQAEGVVLSFALVAGIFLGTALSLFIVFILS